MAITDDAYQQEILGVNHLLNHDLTTGEMLTGVS